MSHLWAIDHLIMELSILIVHKEKNMIVNGTPFTNVSNQDEIKMKYLTLAPAKARRIRARCYYAG